MTVYRYRLRAAIHNNQQTTRDQSQMTDDKIAMLASGLQNQYL
jgi:hypothetical protein